MTEQPAAPAKRQMTMPQMRDRCFDLLWRTTSSSGTIATEAWLMISADEAREIEAIGVFLERLVLHQAEVAKLLAPAPTRGKR